MSNGKKRLAGTGNQNFGYFGGGFAPNFSTVDRVDYNNDTVTASPKGNLSAARSYLGATGNADFGYFAGSNSPSSAVDRVDYSNDTATASPKGDFDISLIKSTANASNPNFGYFGGGSSISTVRRIDFSNDTATPVVRGPLTRNMSHEPGVGARSDGFVPILGPSVVENAPIQIQNPFAYFGAGANPANPAGVSTIDRIDYSSDTSTASPRGNLSSPGTIYGINRQFFFWIFCQWLY